MEYVVAFYCVKHTATSHFRKAERDKLARSTYLVVTEYVVVVHRQSAEQGISLDQTPGQSLCAFDPDVLPKLVVDV